LRREPVSVVRAGPPGRPRGLTKPRKRAARGAPSERSGALRSLAPPLRPAARFCAFQSSGTLGFRFIERKRTGVTATAWPPRPARVVTPGGVRARRAAVVKRGSRRRPAGSVWRDRARPRGTCFAPCRHA
jgi:hypothetical protein